MSSTDRELFLATIDSEAKGFQFRTSGDGEHKQDYSLVSQDFGHVYKKEGGESELSRKLEDLNSRGAGVHVTINETDGSGSRKTENIVRVRAVWQEDDEGFEGTYPLHPSLVVESSPGRFHRYWFIQRNDTLTLDEFDLVMKRMVSDYGSDPSAKDRARTLRLPGTYNNKRDEPFLVRIIIGSLRSYGREEILNAFCPEWASKDLRSVLGGIPEITKPVEPEISFWETDEGGEFDPDRTLLALLHLAEVKGADSRDDWFKYGGAIYDASGGSKEGYRLFQTWSETSGKYDEREQKKYWFSEYPRRKTGNRATLATIFHDAIEAGWEDTRGEALKPVSVPNAQTTTSGRLTQETMKDLSESFEKFKHYPSGPQMKALEDLVSHLEALADGKADDFFYLTSLDPGVGKTQSITHFIKRLLASEAHKDVSVLICLGRIAEIRSLVEDMGLKKGDYSVLVADTLENRELMLSGNQSRGGARVLFTTQQMLESRMKWKGAFTKADDFYYHGSPRQIRLWDEACLPARPISLRVTELKKLLAEANRQHKELYRVLDEMVRGMEGKEDGSLFEIPDLQSVLDMNSALQMYSEETKPTKDAAYDLWFLSGKPVVIQNSGTDNIFVHYENTLPDDLKPVLICDASGRVRQTYNQWAKGRGDLLQLSWSGKSYENLKINLWRRGGGKSAWREDDGTLIEGVLKAVNSKPNEEFLILHHMENHRFRKDIPELIKESAVNPSRLHFAHWGGEDYRATNRFQHVENVILAGTLFYDHGYYDALGRLSQGLKPEDKLSKEDYDDIRGGEHAQVILQALCRGSVRKSDGPNCKPCEAWIIAAPNSRIPKMLEDGSIFPDAKVLDWVPFERKLSGLVQEGFEYTVGYFDQEPKGKLQASKVMRAIGIEDRRNWDKNVLNHPDFLGSLHEKGIRLVRKQGKGGSYFEKVS